MRENSKKKGIKYNATFGQALQWGLSTMIEKHIMPQVSNCQWLKNLKVMIQTQVMTASKITTVMPVLCDYILGMICLLNALPRPLVPLTLCQPSNLAGINFQPCKSLRSPLIPAQTSALALFPSLPLQQEALRAFSLCCPTSKGSLCTHIHGILPSKGDVWRREPGVTEIPGQQVKHLG